MPNEKISPQQKQMARFAKAMGHPIRLAILQMLAAERCCYHGDMSEILPVAKSTLSQHLNALKEAGLIQGEVNPPAVRYCIHHANWALVKKQLGGFIDEVAASQSRCE